MIREHHRWVQIGPSPMGVFSRCHSKKSGECSAEKRTRSRAASGAIAKETGPGVAVARSGYTAAVAGDAMGLPSSSRRDQASATAGGGADKAIKGVGLSSRQPLGQPGPITQRLWEGGRCYFLAAQKDRAWASRELRQCTSVDCSSSLRTVPSLAMALMVRCQ